MGPKNVIENGIWKRIIFMKVFSEMYFKIRLQIQHISIHLFSHTKKLYFLEVTMFS